MNNGMRPGIFHNPDPTYEKTAVKLHFESKRVRGDIEAFFEEIRRCRKHIDSLNQYRQQYEMDLFSLKGCRYDKEPVDGGTSSDLSDIVIAFEQKMAKSEELRIKELSRYGDMITRGFKLLALLSDPEQKSIMIDRYFMNVLWEKIALEHHYVRSHCYRLKDEAIKEISQKMKHETL
ncbi:MAG: hypothetical protein ACLSF8_00725 [Dialister invisus]|uniref:hypothetical protein n=1 Tax=Dialister invisus TaxID=218538 RepID=UPI002065254E|nr:MAG TPA: Protein of unknown function (DUF1492) [Caudoviricetes sp.]